MNTAAGRDRRAALRRLNQMITASARPPLDAMEPSPNSFLARVHARARKGGAIRTPLCLRSNRMCSSDWRGFHYLGKPGPHDRDRAVAGFSKPNSVLLERTLKSMVTASNCPRDDVRILRAVIEKLKTSDAPVIYSNELLCENKYVSFADIAAGISDIFGPSELIITVRGPQTALPSAYLHEMMRFPDTESSFTKWLDDAISDPRRINRPAGSLEQYRYTLMHAEFQTAFNGRITILKYED